MPELPDLEIIREVLAPRLTGQTIADVEVVRPLVMRDLTGEGFGRTLADQTISGVERRGKVLLFPLQSGLTLAINCKLAGRLQYARPTEHRLPKTHVVIRLSNGQELRYSDRRTMGQVYLTAGLEAIPGWGEMGPET
jgi:formamidopyrimidine-DNA glycosylase